MISMKRQEVQNSRIKPAEMISNEDDILINGSSKFSSVLFLRVPPSSNKLKYHFFSLNENPIRDPIRSLTFADDSASINILQSCNGLLSSPHLYRLEIYSSETQLWSFSSEIPKVNYSRWAYCCGAIYWMSYSRNFLCFDVDKERFQDPSLLQKPKRLEEHETERASEREKEIKEGKTHSPANIKRREII
ncbi:hypothetical protein QQP08_010963 [Theobroma cacao]|nr:hypothetical protein QQP08_010963 [Theobroma cacao]